VTDDWTPVEVNQRGLTSVQSLAAASGLVGLIDMHTDGHTKVFISTTGDSGDWQAEDDACPAGTDPVSLSAAAATLDLEQVSSLWVKCQGATSAAVRYTNSAAPGMWHDVPATGVSASALVAAQSPSSGIVAGPGELTKISLQKSPAPVLASSFGVPTYVGFTNDRYGYLLDSDGNMLATTDGGDHWAPYTVSDTN